MWVRVALLAALVLVVSSCAGVQNQAQASPAESPSSSPAASPAPSATPEAAAVAITNADFHPGEVGFTYSPSLALAATGGSGTYTWTVGGGALPAGLTLSSNGSVYGDPAVAGTFNFTVQVTDSEGATAAAARSVAIAPAIKATLIPACALHCSVEVGCVAVCGTFGTLSGGAGPFTYSPQPGGYVPLGTTVSRSSLALTGTFTAVAKYWQFTVLVTDSSGGAAAITPTFYVFPHLSLARSATCKGDYNTSCSVRIPYSGGTPGGTPKVNITGYGQYCSTSCYPKPTAPPPSFVMTVGGGYVTVSVQRACGYPGIAGCPAGWGGVLYLGLADQSRCGAGTYCSSPGPTALSIEIVGG
jgi:hypothetical protein